MSVREKLTDFCLWTIRKLNDSKSNSLAHKLHELGGMYQKRPQDGWRAPPDWECWKDS